MTSESTFAHSPDYGARNLIRSALWGSLATYDRQTGFPYVSLISLASDTPGDPLFLISTLARHTQNLEFDSRAAILFSEASPGRDPLESGRVSVMGSALPASSEASRVRFMARHPETAEYAIFTDFALWTLTPELGHYVGGFGRIHTLPGAELRLKGPELADFATGQTECLEQINRRAELLEQIASVRLGAAAVGAPGRSWRAVGVDPEGCDLLLDKKVLRLNFTVRVKNIAELPHLLERMADEC
jgi:heme iron utilization protein